jgi:hypothetical protein
MAATVVLRPPWCPTPGAETINNQPIYYTRQVDVVKNRESICYYYLLAI